MFSSEIFGESRHNECQSCKKGGNRSLPFWERVKVFLFGNAAFNLAWEGLQLLTGNLSVEK